MSCGHGWWVISMSFIRILSHSFRKYNCEKSTHRLTDFMAVCFTEPELLPIEVLHCGNRNYRPFCSCDLDLGLELMTFIYELDAYCWRYIGCAYELSMSRLSKVIVWQTGTTEIIYEVDPHCALHRVATSSCRGHVDILATEPFLLLHREHGTGYRRRPTELKLLWSTDLFRRNLKTFLFHSVDTDWLSVMCPPSVF